MLTPPFPQKLFTFVKQFILEFEEIPQTRGKLETLLDFNTIVHSIKYFFQKFLVQALR